MKKLDVTEQLCPFNTCRLYGIGRAFRFGFGQSRFLGRVPGRNVWMWCVLVVAGREGVGAVCGALEKVRF